MEDWPLPGIGSQVWTFDSFTLDEAAFELRQSDKPVAIEPQSLRLLLFLIRHRDRVVTKDDLVDAIWQGRAVSDWAISGAIKAVRAALGDTDRDKRLIKTIHGRGFRFVADVISQTPETASASKPTVLVRIFRSGGDDAQLAYLADGLADDLISTLSRSGAVKVLSYNTTRAMGDAVPPGLYGVTHIIDGSIRAQGSRTRITANILDQSG